MGGLSLLQVFLVINVFIIGGLSVLAAQYALAHYRPHRREADKPKASTSQDGHLPAAVKQKLLQASQANFQAVLERSANELQHDLDATASQLNRALGKIGTEIVGNEMERYRLQLEEIRQHAASAIGNAEDSIRQHQAELQAELEATHASLKAQLAADISAEKERLVKEIVTEKQRLMSQIDQRLADAMASFLLENLGHNVDLGAQMGHLTALLDEHKDDFKKELRDGN